MLTNQLINQKKDKIKILLKKKLELFGIENFQNLSIHFWKYAFSDSGSGIDSYLNNDLNLGLCGDGFGQGKVDGAITSADILVKNVIYLSRQPGILQRTVLLILTMSTLQ